MNTQPISGMSNRDVRESLVFLFALDEWSKSIIITRPNAKYAIDNVTKMIGTNGTLEIHVYTISLMCILLLCSPGKRGMCRG